MHWNIGDTACAAREVREYVGDDVAEKLDEMPAERIFDAAACPRTSSVNTGSQREGSARHLRQWGCGPYPRLTATRLVARKEKSVIELANEAGGDDDGRFDDRLPERAGENGLMLVAFQYEKLHEIKDKESWKRR